MNPIDREMSSTERTRSLAILVLLLLIGAMAVVMLSLLTQATSDFNQYTDYFQVLVGINVVQL